MSVVSKLYEYTVFIYVDLNSFIRQLLQGKVCRSISAQTVCQANNLESGNV